MIAAPEPPVMTAFKAPLYVAWETTHRCNAKCAGAARTTELAGDR